MATQSQGTRFAPLNFTPTESSTTRQSALAAPDDPSRAENTMSTNEHIARLESELTASTRRIGSLQGTIKKQTNLITTLQGNISEKLTSIEEMAKELSLRYGELEERGRTIKMLRKTISTLQGDLDAKAARVSILEAEAAQIVQAPRSTPEVASAQESLTLLQDQIRSKMTIITSLEEEIQTGVGELARATNESAALRDANSLLEHNVLELQHSIQNERATVSRLETALAEAPPPDHHESPFERRFTELNNLIQESLQAPRVREALSRSDSRIGAVSVLGGCELDPFVVVTSMLERVTHAQHEIDSLTGQLLAAQKDLHAAVAANAALASSVTPVSSATASRPSLRSVAIQTLDFAQSPATDITQSSQPQDGAAETKASGMSPFKQAKAEIRAPIPLAPAGRKAYAHDLETLLAELESAVALNRTLTHVIESRNTEIRRLKFSLRASRYACQGTAKLALDLRDAVDRQIRAEAVPSDSLTH